MNMVNLIVGWLRSARDQDVHVPDLMHNLDAVDEGLLMPDEIYNAANSASMMVANEQGGQLTMHQQNLLMQINGNIQVVPEDPMIM